MTTPPSNSNPGGQAPVIEDGRLLAGRYRLLEKIGEGGAAEVFRARDERLGRVIAVKLLRPQYTSDETWRKRFVIEARAAAGLSHSNIVPVYDFGEGPDGAMFIAMQYVAGRDLREVLWERGKLPAAEAVAVARQVCDALSVAHARGLVHRDVKPQNIMIDSHGSPCVMEFGIVKGLTGTELTQAGMTFGTAAYLSPEQATGMPVGPGSDIYSLGCVMYEMLSGVPPFTGDSPAVVAYMQVWEQPRPLRELVADIPGSLNGIVMRCLNKDPAHRYPTAQALAHELEMADLMPENAPALATGAGVAWTPDASDAPAETMRPAAAPVVAGGGVHAVPPVRVQTTAIPATPLPPAQMPYRPVASYFGGAGSGQVVNVFGWGSTRWLALAAVLVLMSLGLLGFAAGRGRPAPVVGVDSNPPVASSPTAIAVSQAPVPPPPSFGQIAVIDTLTPSPAPIPSDTPVPATEAPPTDTPIPPPPVATDTPPPATPEPQVENTPPPTKTPRHRRPTNTPAPQPPADTPLPASSDTETPVAPAPTPAVSELERVVNEAIAHNPKAVADYLNGKKAAFLTLLQDVWQRAQGRIDLAAARDLLLQKLEALRHNPNAPGNPNNQGGDSYVSPRYEAPHA
jgi:tRNA A-37 threonylcarbamoyl transferase component Bud32